MPLLEVAPNRYLAELNAILWYVAGGTTLAPEDRIDRAEAMQWMFFEQHSLEPNIGAAYFWLTLVKGGRDLQQHALEDWMENGYRALGVMEMHLASRRFFVGEHFTIADIALYAYTHVAQPLRLRPHALSRRPRLARPRRGRTRPRGDGVAAGGADRGAITGGCRFRHENAAFNNPLCLNRNEPPPGSCAIVEQLDGQARFRFVMRTDIDGPGFKAPTLGNERHSVALAEMIAIAGLALSTIVAATVVSVGIAHANVAGNVIDNEGSLFTIALVLGLVFIAMGGLTLFTLPGHRQKKH